MNSGFDNNIGTMKNIVTNAVIDIIKPEIAYDRYSILGMRFIVS